MDRFQDYANAVAKAAEFKIIFTKSIYEHWSEVYKMVDGKI